MQHEIHRQTPFWLQHFEDIVTSGIPFYTERWKSSNIDPLQIKKIVQLGPGVGTDTAIFLTLFPNASMHLIDIYDDLHISVKSNPRVTFCQGKFVEILERQQMGFYDLTILRFIGSKHGFNEKTAGLLQKTVGTGYLLTDGDNGLLESQSWFRTRFNEITALDINISLWKTLTKPTLDEVENGRTVIAQNILYLSIV